MDWLWSDIAYWQRQTTMSLRINYFVGTIQPSNATI